MTRTTQTSSLLALTGLIALAVLLVALPASAEQSSPSKVVVHLGHYSDDLHAASMAMSLARLLQTQGADVTVFLDREGVRLVDKRGPKDLRWGDAKESVVEIFADFVAKGGSALVCPHCAKVTGLGRESLRSGARLGTQDEVAQLFLNADRVIDY